VTVFLRRRTLPVNAHPESLLQVLVANGGQKRTGMSHRGLSGIVRDRPGSSGINYEINYGGGIATCCKDHDSGAS
jgi:hypothetical protein